MNLSIKWLVSALIAIGISSIMILGGTAFVSNYVMRQSQGELIQAINIAGVISEMSNIISSYLIYEEKILTTRNLQDLISPEVARKLKVRFDNELEELDRISQVQPELIPVIGSIKKSYEQFLINNKYLPELVFATLSLNERLDALELVINKEADTLLRELGAISGKINLQSARNVRNIRTDLKNVDELIQDPEKGGKILTELSTLLKSQQIQAEEVIDQIVLEVTKLISMMHQMQQETNPDSLINLKNNEMVHLIENVSPLMKKIAVITEDNEKIRGISQHTILLFQTMVDQLIVDKDSVYNLRIQFIKQKNDLFQTVDNSQELVVDFTEDFIRLEKIVNAIGQNAIRRAEKFTLYGFYAQTAVAIAVLIAMITIGWYILTSITHSINNLIGAMQDISSGKSDLSRRVDVSGLSELTTVSHEFNTMVEKLDAAQNMLKEINAAYNMFVPHKGLQLIGKESILDVDLGDSSQKIMTVLFSDIRGFTSLSEKMTPEENFDFINLYLGQINPIIKEYDGFIDKYIGDAIMALFPGENAELAIDAGLGMLKKLDTFNRYRLSTGETPIRIGVGINTGRLMLGTIGHKERMEETVIGDTVNLASRIESLNKNYGTELIISEGTYQRIKDPTKYDIRFIGIARARGKEQATGLYEIYSLNPDETRKQKQITHDMFNKALDIYQEKDFLGAKKMFEDCLKQSPNDTVAKYYILDIENNLKNNQK